jgi:hypothetical protein
VFIIVPNVAPEPDTSHGERAPGGCRVEGRTMTDPFIPYTIILNRGQLSPAEDLETAIIAAAQSEACGHAVARIERGEEVILEGEKLRDVLAKHARDRTPLG